MNYPRINVIWEDIISESEWSELPKVIEWAQDTKAGVVQSTGFLVYEDDSYIVIAQDWMPASPESFNGYTRIPKSVIKSSQSEDCD
jgi:hypothetical protein